MMGTMCMLDKIGLLCASKRNSIDMAKISSGKQDSGRDLELGNLMLRIRWDRSQMAEMDMMVIFLS